MKMKIVYEFVTPISTEDLEEKLLRIRPKEWIKNHLDKYLYFLHSVNTYSIYRKDKQDEYARLHSTHLQTTLGGRYYPTIKNDLIDLKIVDDPDNYSNANGNGNSKCYGFKFKPEYDNKFFINISKSNSALIKKLSYKPRKIDTNNPLKKRLSRSMKLLTVSNTVYESLTPKEKKHYFCLKNRRFQSEGKSSKRIYNNFSNVISSLRKKLTINGENLVFVDIVNSQMVFLAAIIKEYCIKNSLDIDPTTQEFDELAASGKIYPFIMEITGEIDRKKTKESIFQIIFGKSYKKNKDLFKILSARFPQLIQIMKIIKKKDGYKSIAHLLQNKECKVIFEALNSINYIKEILSIHDSLYAAKSDQQTIINALVSSFRNNGIRATINVNDDYTMEIDKTKSIQYNFNKNEDNYHEVIHEFDKIDFPRYRLPKNFVQNDLPTELCLQLILRKLGRDNRMSR